MQTIIIKGYRKIISRLENLGKIPKLLLSYGFIAFLTIFLVGTILSIINHYYLGLDNYIQFISLNLIKSSFTILAEIVIGSLIMDFVFNKE